MDKPSKNELLSICRSDGIIAHKGLDYDVLYKLAMDVYTPGDDDLYVSPLHVHRARAARAGKGIPGVNLSGCDGICHKCSDAETLNCIDESSSVIDQLEFKGEAMKFTRKELEGMEELQLRSMLRVDHGVSRQETFEMTKVELIDLITSKTGGATAPEDEAGNEPNESAPASDNAAADADTNGESDDGSEVEDAKDAVAAVTTGRKRRTRKKNASAAEVEEAPAAAEAAAAKAAENVTPKAAEQASAATPSSDKATAIGQAILDAIGTGGGGSVDNDFVRKATKSIQALKEVIDNATVKLGEAIEDTSSDLSLEKAKSSAVAKRVEALEKAIINLANLVEGEFENPRTIKTVEDVSNL